MARREYGYFVIQADSSETDYINLHFYKYGLFAHYDYFTQL